MQIISSALENGMISARLLIEYDDIVMAAGQQAAVQQAIVALSEALGVSDVHYASVNEMTELDSGDIEIALEAAVSPEVTLGQYKDLKIKIGHNEDFEQAVLNAAADNISVDIPELIIDRQLDGIVNEARSEVLQSTSLHTLADVHSIISRLNLELKDKRSDDEVWQQAMKAAESYINKNAQEVELMVEAIKEVCKAKDERIFRGIVTRAQERAKMTAEEIAEQVFEAYLRTEGKSLDDWRCERKELAEKRCRVELMLKAVIKAEGICPNVMEVQQSAYEIACSYGMNVDEFLSYVGEEGIRAQLCQQKAIKLIVDSAKGI